MKSIAEELAEHLRQLRERNAPVPPPEPPTPQWEDEGGAMAPDPSEGLESPPA